MKTYILFWNPAISSLNTGYLEEEVYLKLL